MPEMSLFFLQVSYFKEDNPLEGRVILIVIGAIIVVSILYRVLVGLTRSSPVGKALDTGQATPKRFNAFALHRVASSYGLDREQTKLLEYVFRNEAVSDPARVMSNSTLLDRHFKRAFRTIEKNSSTDEDAQQRLLQLFSLRNAIEASPGMDSSSNMNLAGNTPAILGTGKDNYPVKVLIARGSNIVTEIPKNSLGTPIRIAKGTRVSLSFFTKSSNGFSYDGQVTGSLNTDQGPGLQILHSGRKKPLAKRNFRRRQTDIQCDFFFVNLEENGSGRKKSSKLVVDNRKFIGTIQDISVGGCSLKTSAPVQAGSRLKISIDFDGNSLINVLGLVLRSNRSGTATILHVKFLKVPRRAFNSISTIVFGYNDLE